MPTLKEVAQRAGVSLGTASKVLSASGNVAAELRDRVHTAARELKYRTNQVARGLKTGRSRMIGMVISDITNPFFPEMVRGAEDAAIERGYVLTIFNTDDRIEREQMVFDILQSRGADGILAVVALPKRGKHEHLSRAIEGGIPVVCLDRLPRGIDCDSVTVDNVGGVASGVEQLASQGHRKIGYIGGHGDLYISADRKRGFEKGMELSGLPVRPEWMKEGDFRPDSGYVLTKELMQQRERPTAIFVANILMTIGVLRAAEEMSLSIPGDLAIATFDHIALTDAFRPKLTVVEQPSYEIGRRGVELLLDRIDNPDAKRARLRLSTKLVVRESSLKRIRSQRD